MHLMVYAAYGRAGIYMMQEYCRLLGVRATRRSCATSAPRSARSPPIIRSPAWRGGRRISDSPTPLPMRCSTPDRAYTVPQLYAWLERCGLSFARWYEQAPYLPQCGAIASMPHARASRLAAPALAACRGRAVARDHDQARLHRLSRRSRRREPADFVRWGRLAELCSFAPAVDACASGSACPPAPSAVLINRAHTYPDLALPINAAQDRVFAAIDGKRTVE